MVDGDLAGVHRGRLRGHESLGGHGIQFRQDVSREGGARSVQVRLIGEHAGGDDRLLCPVLRHAYYRL